MGPSCAHLGSCIHFPFGISLLELLLILADECDCLVFQAEGVKLLGIAAYYSKSLPWDHKEKTFHRNRSPTFE